MDEVLLYCPNDVGEPVWHFNIHPVVEERPSEAFLTFLDTDGKTRTDGFSLCETKKSTDVYGPLKEGGLTSYLHAMLSEMFQMTFGDDPDLDISQGESAAEGEGRVSLRGTPA